MHLSSCLLDTNILIRITKSQSTSYPDVSGAVDYLLAAGTPLFYTQQNIAEMWNVMTRPLVANGLGLEPREAEAEVRTLERAMALLPENDSVYRHWRALVLKYQIRGVQVHDASLVAVMLAYGLKHIMTLNIADFSRFSEEVATIHPRAVRTDPH